MFFNSKPWLILVLRPTSLSVYDAKHEVATLRLPEALTRYQEVLDKTGLTKAVSEFLTSHHIADSRYLVLLSDGMTFQKVVPRTEVGDAKSLEATFATMIPFAPGERQVSNLQLKDHLVLLGIGTALYQAVIAGVDASGGKVPAVSLLSLYGVRADTITPHQARDIIAKAHKSEALNWLKIGIPAAASQSP